MFAPLFGTVRADIDRQISWARAEVRRQTRHTALIAILTGVATLAALGAIVVALIGVYVWLAARASPFIAFGVIGGGLLLVSLILFGLALGRQRPAIGSRPPLQCAQPAALVGALQQDNYGKAIEVGEQAFNTATDALRHGSRSALLGTLVLVAVMGLIVGRKL